MSEQKLREALEATIWHAMSSAAMIRATLAEYRALPPSVERNYNLLYLSNAVDAALALSSSPEDGWRDIASAPRDGTRALFYGIGKGGQPYMDVTAWPKVWSGKWPIAYMEYADGKEPTHWRPLPLPPTAQKDHADVEG